MSSVPTTQKLQKSFVLPAFLCDVYDNAGEIFKAGRLVIKEVGTCYSPELWREAYNLRSREYVMGSAYQIILYS